MGLPIRDHDINLQSAVSSNPNGLRKRSGLSEGPDDLAHRCGRELDDGWGKKHAVGQCALRLKKHINDFDLMSVWQVLAAKRVGVADARRRVLFVACGV